MLFVDVEPTGLGWDKKNCILELGAEIWINDKKVDDFFLKMKPRSDATYQELKNGDLINIKKGNRYIDDDTAISNADGLMEFKKWLNTWINPMDKEDKAWFVAYNAVERMDERLIRNWFEKNGDPYFHAYFDRDKIDVKLLAVCLLRDRVRLLKNRKLPTMYEAIVKKEVDRNQLHHANYDVQLAAELYYVTKFYRNNDHKKET